MVFQILGSTDPADEQQLGRLEDSEAAETLSEDVVMHRPSVCMPLHDSPTRPCLGKYVLYLNLFSSCSLLLFTSHVRMASNLSLSHSA